MTCTRCGAERHSPAVLARQADRVRAVIKGAVVLDLAEPGDAFAAAYGGTTRHVLRAALGQAADLALEHARAIACLAGACPLHAANEKMERGTQAERTDSGRQFVLMLARDGKVEARKIAEAEILRRYSGYEFICGVADFLETSVPGDSIPVLAERVLRAR